MSDIVASRDVLFGSDSREFVVNHFLQDLVRLHRILYHVQGQEAPTTAAEAGSIVDHVYHFITTGKGFHLAGIRNVPTPFLTSPGTFMTLEETKKGKQGVAYQHKTLCESAAKDKLAEYVLEEFAKPLDGVDEKEAPYKEFAALLERFPVGIDSPENIVPTAKDAIFIDATDTHGVADRIQEHELGNKVIFNVSSTLVSSYTTTSEKRVEAALGILQGLDEAPVALPEGAEANDTPKARFLIRNITTDERSSWTLMDAVQAAFVILAFTFEVYLEKGVHTADIPATHDEVQPSAGGPVEQPTDFDVLFGRGGLTNAHLGNRRFRDVIALHRPDYIRAIKMDKPAVARRIVRSIRQGTPPGRFLKKADDGHWYDVGDRTAAEKTSQGLRERSNAEKRQRSALREALRIRKQDMADGGDGDKKPVAAPAPTLPMLNYVGTNLAVPLSLGMREPPRNTVKRRKVDEGGALSTEGLPPNAVDEDGNILVTDHDILCGRGGLTNHHKGNKRFRDIVALHRPDYVRAPKIQKPSVARVIVRAIRNGDPPGRFLRKDEKTGKWIDIGDKKAAEKTSQALREKTNEEREKLKKDPGATAASSISLLPGTTDFLAVAGTMMAGLPAAVSNVVTGGRKTKEEEKELSVQDPTADLGKAKSAEELAASVEV